MHYEKFTTYIPPAMEQGWLIYEQPKVYQKGYFYVNKNDINNNKLPIFKQYLYCILVLLLIISFWCSFYGFYWTLNLSDTVTNGINVLDSIDWYWYFCFYFYLYLY